jgi:hypothetical protein
MVKKGADPSIILDILNNNYIKNLKEFERKEEVKKRYSEFFGKTSKETIKANIREDVIVNNQKNRFLAKLPQDLKKLDLIAAHYDKKNDIIVITLSQQKGNNASFNSTSESKTLECISKCINEKTYVEFFNLLPENLNPIKTNKNYKIDVCVGMVNARGENIKKYDNVEIKYLTNDYYLSYLGLEVSTVDIAFEICYNSKITEHSYDAITDCGNWDYIYDKCKEKLNIND